MTEPGSDRPEDCSLLVAITFHYNSALLPILLDVVRTLTEFPVRSLECIIVTNGDDSSTADMVRRLFIMRRLLSPWFTGRRKFDIKVCGGFEDPFDLPWQAKPIIKERFLNVRENYTHFIHLEDDMRFNYRNFSYWHHYRPLIADSRLIPSFVRVEFSAEREELCCTDITNPINFAGTRTIAAGKTLFLTPPNPYTAMYIFDRTLAEEYVASRSFDRDGSLEVRPTWDTRARAASGLCWENPPEGFNGRHAIPVDTATGSVPPEAWLHHLSNRYADSPSHFGKLPVLKIVHR